jgi:2-phosphosulfolactate phosphatase
VTIVAGLRAGAARVLPVLAVEEAERYLGDPCYRLAGERGGAKLPQFHFGNSPTEILAHRAEVEGRVLVVTTSNGTRCVNAALGGAAAVLAGSTINASAVARAAWELAIARGADVTLLAAGLRDQPSSEDTYAQGLLARRLVDLGAVPAAPVLDVQEVDILPIFVESEAAGRLTVLGYAEDVRLCAQIDLWDTVPIYRQDGFCIVAC